MKFQGVFDIETHHWTNFIMGGCYDGQEYIHFDDELLMVQYLISRNGIWYAHNGGHFDTLWLIQRITAMGLKHQISLVGSRVHSLTVAKLTVRDSMSLLPFSLAKAGKIVHDSKDNLSVPFEKFDNLTESERSEVAQYMKQDCVLLYRVLERLTDFCVAHQINLRTTIGATAVATAKTETEWHDRKWDRGEWMYSRSGYYGGRVEVYQTQVPLAYRYDINSSYTNALVNTSLPIGQPLSCSANRAEILFDGGIEGIFDVTVDVPYTQFGPLPYRQYGRIWFPWGTFQGRWTGLEIREALSMGAKIKQFHSALVWAESEPILAPWCKRIYQLRMDFGQENEGWKNWLKWLLNSLTGKLAQRDEMSTLKRLSDGEPTPCDGASHPHTGPCPTNTCCPHRCIGACGRWESLDEAGTLWRKTYRRIPSHAKPHWAAYLTSAARIQLLRQLVDAEENAIYCDTDSIYRIGRGRLDVGPELGQWTYEGEAREWTCLAPKIYRYRDEDGNETIKGKGVSGLTWEGFDTLANGDTFVTGDRPTTYRVGVKKGNVWTNKSVHKQLHPVSGWIGARLLGDTRDTWLQTYAPSIDAIKDRMEKKK